MWFKKPSVRKARRRSRRAKPNAHYTLHKPLAREILVERVAYWNQFYGFTYNRIAIRDQKRCWGSCSAKGNLNLNYKLIFLPEELMDYVIVHELCHLAHLNHSATFWLEVEKGMKEYKERRAHLRRITNIPHEGFPSSVAYRTKNAAMG